MARNFLSWRADTLPRTPGARRKQIVFTLGLLCSEEGKAGTLRLLCTQVLGEFRAGLAQAILGAPE
jgi:hypothetical protein